MGCAWRALGVEVGAVFTPLSCIHKPSQMQQGGVQFALRSVPPVCTCDHPTLDPTPRQDPEPTTYSPVKRTVAAASGVRRARKEAADRRRRAERGAAVVAAEEDASYVAAEVERLAATSDKPVRLSSIDFDADIPVRATRLDNREDFAWSSVALDAWQAERRRGETGFSAADVLLRHRRLMKRRAVASTTFGHEGEGLRLGNEDEAATLAAARADQEREALRVRRLTESPPTRFWWLLLLWLVGGYAGAHRASLRTYRIAFAQVSFVAVELYSRHRERPARQPQPQPQPQP